MKCQYCGGNLGLENEVCPFCGHENIKAKKYIATRKGYQKEYDETKQKVRKQVIINRRTGKLIIIALMVVIVAVMSVMSRESDDIDSRIERREQEIKQTVEKDIDSISAKLKEMEKNREYLEMSYYVTNYRLHSQSEFDDYTRVFTAAGSYRGIFEDILNIASGFDYYGEKDIADWCNIIANTIATWNQYVDGEFWKDAPDSPMHAGEHGAFLADIKEEVRDIVQVFFHLDDEQAESMWTIGDEELGTLLYDHYLAIDSEVNANE